MATRTATPMPRPADTPRAWRILLAGLVFPVLAIAAGAQTLAIVGESTRPKEAAAAAPWDGSAKAHLAKGAYQGQLAAGEAVAPPEPWIVELARDAYRRQPLTPEALAVIGASLPDEQADAFWELAAQVSRRDTLLQGLLLDHHLGHDDLDRSIRVLNQLLLVRENQRERFFAALSQALPDPRSIDPFVEILAADPKWGDAFLVAASRNEEGLENLSRIRHRLPDGSIEAHVDQALISAFARSGQLDLAHDLHRRLAQKQGERPGWQASTIPPFDWRFVDEPGFRAQRVPESEQLDLLIARGKGGPFVTRIFRAQGSSIRLRANHQLEPAAQARRLSVSVSCAATGEVLAQENFSERQIALDTAIPERCPFVAVVLSGRAWSDEPRLHGTISPITVTFGAGGQDADQ
ncbi:MAG: hypothetical protein VX569_13725 [Pseudomonadota bacterium]|nr:hypothetical protein [Pseudomonadota bacterium]